MADLDDVQKRAIIRRLARFATPKEVAKEFKEAFGVDLTPQQICAYNPTTIAGDRLSAEHKKLFQSERRKCLADEDKIEISKRSYRLVRLMQIAETSLNGAVQLKALETAAKEMGGLFVRPETKTEDDGQAARLSQALDAAVQKVYSDPSEPTEQTAPPGDAAG